MKKLLFKLSGWHRLPRRLAGLVIVAVMLLSALPATAASTGSTITTSPVSADLSVNPGATANTSLQLMNNGTKAVNMNVKLEEFKANGQDGQAQIFAPPANDPTTQWVHFSQTSFVAQPGVWNNITMTISPPATAALGYYYAVLFVPGNATAANSTEKVKGANAILVLVNVHSPNETNALSVQKFTVSKSSYQYLPVNFNVSVHNNGNIYTAPSGDIFISRTRNGSPIGTIDLNSGGGNVLPGTSRTFQDQWTDGFPVFQLKRLNGQIVSDKKGQPIQQLKWDFTKVPKFRYGKYYARLVMVYNNGSRDVAVNGVVSFWVIPWKLILLVIFIVIGIIVFWESIKRLFRQVRKGTNRGVKK